MTQQVFAEHLGVSRSYLAEVERGKGKPSLEMIVGIAEQFPEISRDWLLTGDGSMYREPDTDWPESTRKRLEAFARKATEGGLGTTEEQQEIAFLKKRVAALEEENAQLRREAGADVESVRLGDIPKVLDSGPWLEAWPVLAVISAYFPDPVHANALESELAKRRVVRTRAQIARAILLLRRQGIIRPTDGHWYTLSDPVVTVRTRDLVNIAQHGTAAMQMLAEKIIPLAEQGNGSGYLVTGEVTLPSGRDSLPSEIVETVREMCNDGEGGDATVRVVLGVGLVSKRGMKG